MTYLRLRISSLHEMTVKHANILSFLNLLLRNYLGRRLTKLSILLSFMRHSKLRWMAKLMLSIVEACCLNSVVFTLKGLFGDDLLLRFLLVTAVVGHDVMDRG